MRFYRKMLIAMVMGLVSSHAAAEQKPVAATPIGSPGAWATDDDFPAAALGLGIQGTVAFKLTVDATGKPARCEITQSSGFDVLDTTTCDKLMARALFTPASDASGKPVAGTYASRIHWALPVDEDPPVKILHSETVDESDGTKIRNMPGVQLESVTVTHVSLDPSGAVTTCQLEFLIVGTAGPSPTIKCPSQMIESYSQEYRDYAQGHASEIELTSATVFSPGLRASLLEQRAGFVQRGLYVFSYTVARDGKVGTCAIEQQRGDMLHMHPYCGLTKMMTFGPPLSTIDKDGVAKGWHIERLLQKSEQ